MFRTLSQLVKKDTDLPARTHTNQVLSKFLDDTIYDLFEHEFHEEYNGAGEYIAIAKRAPSVRYGMLNTVVCDSVSFVFSEGRFPAIDAGDDEKAEETIEGVIKDCALNDVMIDAAQRGSVGSVVVWVRVLNSRLFFKALSTTYLTPHFKPDAPDTLEKVVELYKVKGANLKALGYKIEEKDAQSEFWFQREWNEKKEVWFVPTKVSDKKPSKEDLTAGRTVAHGLGFVPMVWIKNLPGGDEIDGACTFRLAIPNSIEIDYQLSQAGRGLKYSSSPTLVIKDANSMSTSTKHVVGDALVIPTDGAAELLEIHGGAAEAVLTFCEGLRKMALESVGGSRADSDKLSAATSGRAMELMNQPLINLADKLRSSYGENGLLRLLQMVVKISNKLPLKDSKGAAIAKIKDDTKLSLIWPRWFAPTSDDRQADANAISVLKAANVLTTKTAVRAIAADYDIEDITAECSELDKAAKQAQENQLALKVPKPPAQSSQR
jgi:hypothetical protein